MGQYGRHCSVRSAPHSGPPSGVVMKDLSLFRWAKEGNCSATSERHAAAGLRLCFVALGSRRSAETSTKSRRSPVEAFGSASETRRRVAKHAAACEGGVLARSP